MQEVDTTKYNLLRKHDNTIVRIDGLGNESPEMTQDYYASQLIFHEQVIANLNAQCDKLVAFEAANPPVELEVETAPEASE